MAVGLSLIKNKLGSAEQNASLKKNNCSKLHNALS